MPLFDAAQEQLRRRSPITKWQIVTVAVPTADTDTIVPHTLPTADPEQLNYELIRGTAAGFLYHDGSATRRPWGPGYVILRASAPMTADVRLTVAADPFRARPLPLSA